MVNQSLGTMTSTSSSLTSSLPESDSKSLFQKYVYVVFLNSNFSSCFINFFTYSKNFFLSHYLTCAHLSSLGFTEENFSQLHVNSDMSLIAKALASPDSGLDVRDRMWLKITIPSAFIGSDLVDWLFTRIQGFTDRREARKYASNLLKVHKRNLLLYFREMT